MILPGILSSQISGHLYTLTGSYDALATVTVPSGGASSIVFSGIPQTGYKHLQIRAFTSATSGSNDIDVVFNGDTSANYASHRLYGTGSSVVSYGAGSLSNVAFVGRSGTSSYFGGMIVDILDYANTNKYKTTRSLTGEDENSQGIIMLTSGLWQSTSAINSIKIEPQSGNSFNQYSSFALYGIK